MNLMQIKMRREYETVVSNNEIIEEEQSNGYNVYASVDELEAWIGWCKTVEGLENLVSEKNLVETLCNTCSDYEINMLFDTLKCTNYKYDYFGHIRQAEK